MVSCVYLSIIVVRCVEVWRVFIFNVGVFDGIIMDFVDSNLVFYLIFEGSKVSFGEKCE